MRPQTKAVTHHGDQKTKLVCLTVTKDPPFWSLLFIKMPYLSPAFQMTQDGWNLHKGFVHLLTAVSISLLEGAAFWILEYVSGQDENSK